MILKNNGESKGNSRVEQGQRRMSVILHAFFVHGIFKKME